MSRRLPQEAPETADDMAVAPPPAELVLASGNAKKLAELRALVEPLGCHVRSPADVLERSGLPWPEPEETEATFVGNGLIKAVAALGLLQDRPEWSGVSVLADDSGLCVEALDGGPGVHSARYAGPTATDAANRQQLLAALAGVADNRRSAHFRCTLVLAGPLADGPGCRRTEAGVPWRAFEGRCNGKILMEEQGDGGFGYDPLFWSDDLQQSFATASGAEKATVSHRGKAVARLALYLRAALTATERDKPLFLRRLGLEALTRALDGTLRKEVRYADQALEQALHNAPQLGSKERAAVADLHWHALRRMGRLALARLALKQVVLPKKPVDPRQWPVQDVRQWSLLALADVTANGLARDPRPKPGVESALGAMCSRNTDLAQLLPYTPDQLHTALRAASYAVDTWPDPARFAAEHDAPEALAATLRADMGDAAASMALQYLSERAPLTLRVNPEKASRDQVQEVLAKAGIAADPIPDLPWALQCRQSARVTAVPAFAAGWFEIQDAGSQRLAQMVGAQPGELVLDWCAGAGGKTLAMAANMQGRGRLVALDRHAARLQECARRLQRNGVTMAQTRVLDASQKGLADLVDKADRVLVDAPCSSSGALRRNPEMRWHMDGDWLGRFPHQQLAIVHRAAKHVRAGGTLVYATCSLMRAENEGVAEAFAASHPDFQIVQQERVGPANPAWLALGPLASQGPDGFYCCVLRRAGGRR